jgi:hypothetical protein
MIAPHIETTAAPTAPGVPIAPAAEPPTDDLEIEIVVEYLEFRRRQVIAELKMLERLLGIARRPN